MKMGIISEEKDWITCELERAMIKKDITPIYIKPSKIASFTGMDIKFKHNKENIMDLKCAFVRNLGNVSNYYRFDVLKYIEYYIPLINPTEGLENAGNKYRTSILLNINNISHPKTVITEDIDKALIWSEKLNDCVLKPLFGNQGKGIVRLNNKNLISKINILNEFKKKYGVFYIQEFINNPNNIYRDIRAFVIGDEVVSAMYRVSDNWITNIHQNGKAEKCELTDEIIELAVKAKNATGLVYGGVDLMESSDGLKVIEVNGAPSWEGLSRVSDVNITEKLIDYVLNNLI
ncbi:tetrahydromethanopterin:alpha-L-glutamate ligase [Methanothermococcus okinawensis]|uniref:Alpha-L-glutamate ligase, RimK family n=1 Tax=Methanothermococcus okinawensis (strain DSM 14208 / JCM 11175 / IH1) TaxID=647113 RepID=F8AN64_METOI|nr:tetrahydromethanopterin:alpha-L-glutamate ligase [Methanothermococcus okinawensis]AEH06980.1 alpha-L-glutamate ligase, RimK family [Methanothermococcus okinawensis IH1]